MGGKEGVGQQFMVCGRGGFNSPLLERGGGGNSSCFGRDSGGLRDNGLWEGQVNSPYLESG